MCGIIGYIGDQPAATILLDGLKRLEYRGYDSAGIAVLDPEGEFALEKRAGKLETLSAALEGQTLHGTIGMGHTRWATHGHPNDTNAHPHMDCTSEVVVVHNGIVENYLKLKARLADTGHVFRSETDTEVLPHLVEDYLRTGYPLEEAVRLLIGEIEGAHAIVVMSRRDPGKIVATRVGNAGGVVVGRSGREMFLASDLPAILPHTRDVVFLADRQIAVLTGEGVHFMDAAGGALDLSETHVNYDPVSAEKGNYKHFMLKEIFEQPRALTDTIAGRAELDPPNVEIEELNLTPEQVAGRHPARRHGGNGDLAACGDDRAAVLRADRRSPGGGR
jgi:glucosamine--fructose-6-phosphate aminotransferase (isomerizing)